MSGAEVVLGIVAGGAGLMSLSVQLIESSVKLNRLYHSMRDAPDTLRDVSDEIRILALSLRNLERHHARDSHEEELIDQCIVQCCTHTASIERLTEKLTQRLEQAALVGRLYIASRERDLERLLDGLNRARAALHLALDIYHKREQDRRWQAQQIYAAEQSAQIARLQHSVQSYHHGLTRQLERMLRPPACDQRCVEVKDKTWSENDAVTPQRNASHRDMANARGRAFRMKLRLPTWFCSRVWEVSQRHHHSGWDLSIRTWNERPRNSDIFRHAAVGDVKGVERLLQNGKASLFDVDGNRSLLWYAIWSSSPSLCRWLIQRYLSTGRSLTDWCDSALFGLRNPRPTFLTVVFQEFDISLDLDERSPLFKSCHDVQIIQFLLHAHRDALRSLSLLQRFQFGDEVFSSLNSVTTYTAKVGLAFERSELAHLSADDGTTALHHVAQALWKPGRTEQHGNVQEDWLRAGVALILNGADLFRAKKSPLNDDRLRTPLLCLVFELRSTLQFFEEVISKLKAWSCMLVRANVDLEWYYKEEMRVWHSSEMNVGDPSPGPNLFATWARRTNFSLLNIIYKPETQRLSLCWRAEALVPVLQLEQPPGSFDGLKHACRTICWVPSARENEQGHWSLRRLVELRGHAFESDFGFDDPDVGSSSMMHFEDRLSRTQDDNGSLMMMVRRSRRRGRYRNRSLSQPATTGRTRIHQEYCSPMHPWLPTYHFCPSNNSWTLSCQPQDDTKRHDHLLNLFGAGDIICSNASPRNCLGSTAMDLEVSEVRFKTRYYSSWKLDCALFPQEEVLRWRMRFQYF